MSSIKNPSAGRGYVVLNGIRILNIIALCTVIVASWVILVKTFIVSKFFFFDAVSHVMTSCVSMFLIVSELPIFKDYFSRNWPLLSSTSGLVGLGLSMVFVGVTVLGNLNKQATSQEALGLPFWRIVIASGILVTLLGSVNIIASYVFQDRNAGVTARQVRSHGAVAAKTRVACRLESSPKKSYRNVFMHIRQEPRVTENRRQLNPKMPVTISAPIVADTEQFRKFEFCPQVSRPNMAYHPDNFNKA